jgi:hypothetical protein
MPPPRGSTEVKDRNADSVWPSGWNLVSVNAGKHTKESEVALDVFVQLLKYKNRLFSSHFFKKTHQFTRFSTKKSQNWVKILAFSLIYS